MSTDFELKAKVIEALAEVTSQTAGTSILDARMVESVEVSGGVASVTVVFEDDADKKDRWSIEDAIADGVEAIEGIDDVNILGMTRSGFEGKETAKPAPPPAAAPPSGGHSHGNPSNVPESKPLDGVGKVINALAYQVRKHPRRKKLKKELRYFRRNRGRMDFARLQARSLPIGSGVVEAANKTLVTVRMKRAGSRWSLDGGQAVLTFRSLSKSDRFDHAWDLLAYTYRMAVEVPENVVPLRRRAG